MNITENYFALFNLPVAYDLDSQLLSERYRQLQRSYHPDRFASASAQERRLSIQYSALINQAFTTLQSPLERAQYLLQLRNGEQSEPQGEMDPAFLMQQMQLRESLGQVREQENPLGALEQLAQQVAESLGNLQQQFGAALEGDDLQRARILFTEMQFLAKLEQEIQALEGDLLDAG